MLRSLLTQQITEEAATLGFQLVGVAPAHAIPSDRLLTWLEREYQGEMGYMSRRPDKRLDPSLVLQGARSIVSVGTNYYHPYDLPYGDAESGAISRYAAGGDYHDLLVAQLKKLLVFIQDRKPGTRGKVYVDTGPVMDKYWANQSGLGWIGKNGNLIANKRLGSWFFIGEVLLDLELDYSGSAADHCGSCTRCIEECPTEAITEPYVVDSRRCISYLTIELKEDIPVPLRESMGNLIFGCDICQDVCPWNRRVRPSEEAAFAPRPQLRHPRLRELAGLSPQDFQSLFRGSPVKRARWRGLMRNVAVAMGNSGKPEMRKELLSLLHCSDPMVRRHAAWALGRIGGRQARQDLRQRLQVEEDGPTRQAIADILEVVPEGRKKEESIGEKPVRQ